MKKILQIVLSFISLVTFAQEAPNPFKFTSIIDMYDFPASGSTGILETNLPLYTIQNSGLVLPLNLSYNQMGNTNVFYNGNQFGDAWNLNSGGTISRKSTPQVTTVSPATVYVSCNGFIMNSYNVKHYKHKPYMFDENYFTINPSSTVNPTPDVYTFSVNGMSGKFIIEKKSNNFGGSYYEAKILEKSDFVKIIIGNINNEINFDQIIIYDKNGYKYVFASPSNINHNEYLDQYYTDYEITVPGNCSLVTSPLHTGLNGSINPNQTVYKGVISASILTGRKFWQNLELTEIYDNNNKKLVTYEYESVGVSRYDGSNAWINGMGMHLSYSVLYLKKIIIENQGQIIFDNQIATVNSGKLVNSYTKSIEIKDLKGALIKKIAFDYHTYQSNLLAFAQPGNFLKLSFNKRFLNRIIESDGTANKNLITSIEYKNSTINQSNTLVDRYGFLVGYNGYCKDHVRREHYKSDFYILNKIKYPTGGSVLYKFGPNIFSYFSGNYTNSITDFNGDNHVYTNVNGVQDLNATFRIAVNPGDTLAILNKIGSQLNVYSSNTNFSYTNLLGNVTRKPNGFSGYIDETYCKHEFTRIVIPANYANNYIYLKYVNNQTNFTNNVYVFKYKFKADPFTFAYGNGSRIEKIGYYTTNVAKNTLDLSNGEALAEKIVTFSYNDPNDIDKSSGNSPSLSSFLSSHEYIPTFYEYQKTSIKNIGSTLNYYKVPSFTWRENIPREVVTSKVYDIHNNLISQVDNQYTYHSEDISAYPSLHFWDFKPFVSKVTSNSKNYEGANYVETSNEKEFNPSHAQLMSEISTDNLGKSVKIEHSYNISTTAPYVLTNTSSKQFVNNVLVEEFQNTYDAKGNLLNVKFKTPEMTALEQIGAVNTYDSNGNLVNSVSADGVSTCYIWGYNKTKIVAKLVNISYTDFTSNANIQNIITHVNNYSNISSANYNEAALKDYLSGLHYAASNALVTCYVYKPMVGISEIIDENGKSTSYIYDSYNRLKTIKDHLGNILKEYEYNFTN